MPKISSLEENKDGFAPVLRRNIIIFRKGDLSFSLGHALQAVRLEQVAKGGSGKLHEDQSPVRVLTKERREVTKICSVLSSCSLGMWCRSPDHLWER